MSYQGRLLTASLGQTEAKGDGSFDLLDGGADSNFLDRERAALGDDAGQFTTANDNFATTVEDAGNDDDLLGGGGGGGRSYQDDGAAGEDMSGFESSFPAIDTQNEVRRTHSPMHLSSSHIARIALQHAADAPPSQQHMAPGGTITGTGALPYLPTVHQGQPGQQPSSYAPSHTDDEEPAVLREWRARRDAAIQARDELSAQRKAETVKAAQAAIDDFYTNYNNKKERSIAQTRREADEFLASRDDTTAGGTSWERIARLVDLGGKARAAGAGQANKERFRELLVSLRKDEIAPGATGY